MLIFLWRNRHFCYALKSNLTPNIADMENQFRALQHWTKVVLEAVKKDLKTDHLHTDPTFYRNYFGNRPQNRLSMEEILSAYEKELLLGNPDLEVFIVNRWVFKHGDLYEHFATRLSAINPDFEQITSLSEDQAKSVLQGAAESFGAIETYLFCVLNRVALPKTVLDELLRDAEEEKAANERASEQAEEAANLEKLKATHLREVSRLHDKIAGVQRKYTTDIEALKKQIRSLQQKLALKP